VTVIDLGTDAIYRYRVEAGDCSIYRLTAMSIWLRETFERGTAVAITQQAVFFFDREQDAIMFALKFA